MKIETLEVAGIATALKAMRLAKESKNDSEFLDELDEHSDGVLFPVVIVRNFGGNDKRLMRNLIIAGDDHAKADRSPIVWFSITCEGHFFDEWNTYRIGVEPLGSTSSMHGRNKDLTGDELEQERIKNQSSYVYTRMYQASYQALRRIYFAREFHRLNNWKIVRNWIETLPYAKEMILVRKNSDI